MKRPGDIKGIQARISKILKHRSKQWKYTSRPWSGKTSLGFWQGLCKRREEIHKEVNSQRDELSKLLPPDVESGFIHTKLKACHVPLNYLELTRYGKRVDFSGKHNQKKKVAKPVIAKQKLIPFPFSSIFWLILTSAVSGLSR